MTIFHCGRAALVCALFICGAARAEEQKPTAPAPAAKPAAAPAATAATGPVTAPKPAAAGAPAAPASMSESKYLSLLYSEIARHTPEDNPAGPGEVTASFIVGASGKVEKVTIDKMSSPAHAEIVKKILAQVVTPPPPGGSMDVGQTFRFR
jgi:hypothetical protein